MPQLAASLCAALCPRVVALTIAWYGMRVFRLACGARSVHLTMAMRLVASVPSSRWQEAEVAAIDAINEAGGVNGRVVVPVFEDVRAFTSCFAVCV